MALEPVTFYLSDFAGNPGLELRPRVVFRPNGLAAGGNKLYFPKPEVVDTFATDGPTTVHLESTDALWHVTGGDAWYDVTVERLVSTYTTSFGAQATADYAPWSYPGWQLKVPPGGGELAALVIAPTNPAQMWTGPARAIPQGTAGWDVPVQDLKPSDYTSWYKTNALPGEQNYFEWGA